MRVSRVDKLHMILDGVIEGGGDILSYHEMNKIYNDKAYLDLNGRLWISGNVSRIGILEYLDESGNGISYQLKKPEDLFQWDSTYSLLGCPITVEHPEDSYVHDKNHSILSVGTVMDIPRESKGYYLKSRLQIFDSDVVKEIVESIRNGEHLWELSCGYSVDVVDELGEWNGMHYDKVHKDMRYNHLSLVSCGRGGKDVNLINEDVEGNPVHEVENAFV